jgi:hypothetical protein
MLGHPGFATWTFGNSDPEKSPDEELFSAELRAAFSSLCKSI